MCYECVFIKINPIKLINYDVIIFACVANLCFTGMGLVSSPFASMNPFALPTCNSQSYGTSPLVGTTK